MDGTECLGIGKRRGLLFAMALFVGVLWVALPASGWAQEPADIFANSQFDVAQMWMRQGNYNEAAKILWKTLTGTKGVSGPTKGRGLFLLASAFAGLNRCKDSIETLKMIVDMPDTTKEQKQQAQEQSALVKPLCPGAN